MTRPNKAIRGYEEFSTNVKGLPEGEYMTETGYSDTTPWKIVGTSPSGKTLKLSPVMTKRDPEWKPEIHPGGFAGNCSNQNAQTWLFDGINEDHVVEVRLRKSRYSGSDKLWGTKGAEFVANGARRFYDYNF